MALSSIHFTLAIRVAWLREGFQPSPSETLTFSPRGQPVLTLKDDGPVAEKQLVLGQYAETFEESVTA